MWQWVVRSLQVLLAALGYAFAVFLAIYPPTHPGKQQLYIIALLIISVVSVVVASMVLRYDEKRHAELLAWLRAFASVYGVANIVQSPQTAAGTGIVSDTPASAIRRKLPVPSNLREQVFGLIAGVRGALKAYHGSLDVDAFVNPEITNAFATSLLAAKNKVQGLLGRNILSPEAQLPITVRRLSKFTDELERATNELQSDVPPIAE